MKPRPILAGALALLVLQALPGANNTPVLSALGKILFPGTSPNSSISDTAGALTVASGGANKNLFVNPSGTGAVSINNASPWSSAKFAVRPTTDQNFVVSGPTTLADGITVHSFNDAVSTGKGFEFRGNPFLFNNAVGIKTGAAPSYDVDVLGDINAGGVFRKAGTAGISTTYTIPAGGSITTSGGIVTATSAGVGVTGVLTVRNSAGTGTCTITVTGGGVTGSTC